MAQKNNYFSKIKTYILTAVIFLFPLFFLPFTQEYFFTNKLLLLVASSLLLLIVSTVEFIVTRKIELKTGKIDFALFLLILSVAFSTLISSPNKIQALITPNGGLITILSLSILYMYLRKSEVVVMKVLSVSTLILSIGAILYFFSPLSSVNLPASLLFLKNPNFTPVGSRYDLTLFIGFFIVAQFAQMILDQKLPITRLVLFALSFISIGLVLYLLTTNPGVNYPSFNLSWLSAIEVLKNPISALFGAGVDNFASIFTKIKDVQYNQSSLWQLSSFNVGRSALLQTMTETGIIGFGSVMIIFAALVRESISLLRLVRIATFLPILFIIIALVVFPLSLPLLFLFFIVLTIIEDAEEKSSERTLHINIHERDGIYLVLMIFFVLAIAALTYFWGRAYLAEVVFKKSIDGFTKNNAKILYDEQRNAIGLNPYIERFRMNFSQTNLLIASNLAQKATQPGDQQTNKPENSLSAEERNIIAQAIQAAIAEGKSAVALNPQKAGNWENLAVIYRNIINVAQGSDAWAISSFERAIILDPQNPAYRLSLGGIYYAQGKYKEAVRYFEQATLLKPDWSNAHYNLGWGLYQSGDYEKAVKEMKTVISLLNPEKDSQDFAKANQDLNAFKAKLNRPEEQITEDVQKPEVLTLPIPPSATFEPKLELPKEASPGY